MSSSIDTYDMILKQGSTFQKSVTWTDDEGNPIDLTNYSARMHLRRKVHDTDPAVVMNTDNGRISLVPLLGGVILNLSATITNTLSGTYLYDLELLNGETVTRILQGKIVVNPSVTKPEDLPPEEEITDLPFLASILGTESIRVVKNSTTYRILTKDLLNKGYIDPHMYGAKGDAVSLPNALIADDYLTVTHTQYSFKQSDVGKTIWIAGGWQDNGEERTIASVLNGAAIFNSPTTRKGSRYVLFGTDDTAAIQAAFDAAETIMLSVIPTSNIGTGNGIPAAGAVVLRNGGYIVRNTQARYNAGKLGAITVPRRCSLIGQGQGATAIYTAPGNVGHSICNKNANNPSNNNSADEKITLGNFSLYGLRDIQGAQCLNGIHLAIPMGGYSMVDAYCQIYNVNVHGSRGSGIYIKGRGENFFTNVNVNFACAHGWDLQTTQDSRWVNCNAGGNYYSGFHVYDAASSSFVNCKSYYNGSNGGTDPELSCNWYIGDANHSYLKGACMFTACESQESRGSGWVIDGGLNQFVGCLSSDPYRTAVGPAPYPDICAGIHLRKNGSNNIFDGFYIRASLGLDWGGSTENHKGGMYSVYIDYNNSSNNKLKGPRGNKGHIYCLEPMTYNVSKLGGPGITNGLNCGLYIDGDPLPGAVPSAPVIIRAVNWDNTTAVIDYTAPTNTGGRAIRRYVVEYKPVGGEWITLKGNVVQGTALIPITGLTLGTSYIFRVSGENVFGVGTASTEFSYTHRALYSMKRQLCSNNQRLTPYTASRTQLYINTTIHAKVPFNANWSGIRVHFDNFITNWNNGSEVTTGMTSAVMKCSIQVGDTIYPCTGTLSLAAGGQGYLDIPNLTLPAGTDFYVHTKATLPAGTKQVPQNTARDMPMWDTGALNTDDNTIDVTVTGVSQGAIVGRTVSGGNITALSFNASTGKGTRYTAASPDVYAYEKQSNSVVAFKKIGTATVDGNGGVASVTLTDGTPPTGATWTNPTIVVTNGSIYPDGAGTGWAPNIITGIPDKPVRTVMGLGSDIMKGELVNTTDLYGNSGIFEMGVASRCGFGNVGIGGAITAYNIVNTTFTRTLNAYAPYCTDVIVELGYGDWVNSKTVASTIANMQTIRTTLVGLGLRVNFAKMISKTSSTDGWITTANQTPAAGVVAFRTTLNTALTDGTIVSDDNIIDQNAMLLTGDLWSVTGGYVSNDGFRPIDVVGSPNRNGISRAADDATFKANFNYLV